MDVLQIDAASETSSMEEQKRCGSSGAPDGKQGGSRGGGEPRMAKKENGRSGEGAANPPAGDDLRNYAYEGDGSSPGSLSSCKLEAVFS